MKKYQILGLLFLLSINSFGQILNDTTAQVVAHWGNNEKYSYSIVEESFEIIDSDTIPIDLYEYVVDITIVDSTENSYIVDWFYRDYKSQSEDELTQKLLEVTEGVTMRFRTNEYGTLEELVNWKEVSDYVSKVIKLMKKENRKNPFLMALIEPLSEIYSSKESIENNVCEEVRQYYYFHGLSLKLDEKIVGNEKYTNSTGGEPFDMKREFYLKMMYPEHGLILIVLNDKIDSEQLTEATFDQMTENAKLLGNQAPNRKDFLPVSSDTFIESLIHNSGLVSQSIESEVIIADGVTKVKKRTISFL